VVEVVGASVDEGTVGGGVVVVSGADGVEVAVVSTACGRVLSTDVGESELHPASRARRVGMMSNRDLVMASTVHD
jgi:hypothetical protein